MKNWKSKDSLLFTASRHDRRTQLDVTSSSCAIKPLQSITAPTWPTPTQIRAQNRKMPRHALPSHEKCEESTSRLYTIDVRDILHRTPLSTHNHEDALQIAVEAARKTSFRALLPTQHFALRLSLKTPHDRFDAVISWIIAST